MTTSAKILIGGLGIAVAALAIGFGVLLAADMKKHDDYWMSGGGPYGAMMRAAGDGDWQSMQAYMRQVLGDDDYQRMREQMNVGHCWWSSRDANLDDFMHDVGYGMMYRALNNGAAPPASQRCW
jgi:hypothetical protein